MDMERALKLNIAALTDIGCKRTNNEDSFGYDLASGIFVVCDGMGGMAAGEIASSTAVKELLGHFGSNATSEASCEERLRASIVHANQEVRQLAKSDETFRGMGTTLVSACVNGRNYVIGNVGDSRAYLLRAGACTQITYDHSFVAEQVRKGSMNAEEARASPFQSLITRAIGTADSVEPDLFPGDFENGDILLLTSDGLTRYADADAIAEILMGHQNLQEACQALIETAKSQGAADNVTCLLIQFPGEDEGSQTGQA